MGKPQRIIEHKTGVSIDAPPDKVWEVLVDLDHYSEWNPLFVHARGTVALGETLHIKTRLPVRILCGAPMTKGGSSKVTKVETNESLEWVTTSGFLRGTHFFHLKPSSDGKSTELIQGQQYEARSTGLFSSMDDGRMGLVAMSRALKLAVERRTNGGELVLVGDDDDDDNNNGNNTTRVVVSTDKSANKAPIASNTTTTNVEKDGLDAVERDKAAVTELAGTIHAANAAAADAATTPTSPLTTETPSGETTTKEGVLSSPADDTMTLATTTTTTKIATYDASETIQVLGSRGITSEDAKTPASTAATPEPLASSQDGSKNDNNGGHDDSEAIVQGLDMSDRQAVDAAMRAKNDAASPSAAAVDNNAASEGGLPPSSPTQAQAGTTHRSFAERLSMLSTHSGLQTTAEVDKSEVDKAKHQQQPQSDDNNNNSREDEDKGDGEADDHGKLPKLDAQPFQLGLDLSLGSGLDFTF